MGIRPADNLTAPQAIETIRQLLHLSGSRGPDNNWLLDEVAKHVSKFTPLAEHALARNESTPTVCPEETPLVGPRDAEAIAAKYFGTKGNLRKQLAEEITALRAARREPGPGDALCGPAGSERRSQEWLNGYAHACANRNSSESKEDILARELAAGPGDRAMAGAREAAERLLNEVTIHQSLDPEFTTQFCADIELVARAAIERSQTPQGAPK
jgi:hypothetical protein